LKEEVEHGSFFCIELLSAAIQQRISEFLFTLLWCSVNCIIFHNDNHYNSLHM